MAKTGEEYIETRRVGIISLSIDELFSDKRSR